jgi:hypothetical protein
MEAETDDRDLYSGIDPGVTPQRVMNGAAESLGGFSKKPPLAQESVLLSRQVFADLPGYDLGLTTGQCTFAAATRHNLWSSARMVAN